MCSHGVSDLSADISKTNIPKSNPTRIGTRVTHFLGWAVTFCSHPRSLPVVEVQSLEVSGDLRKSHTLARRRDSAVISKQSDPKSNPTRIGTRVTHFLGWAVTFCATPAHSVVESLTK